MEEIVFNALKLYIDKHRYAPSVSELKKITGLNNLQIHDCLIVLKAKGYIEFEPRKARAIALNVEHL